ncbi:Pyridine nucleotide-disulfide oxidoreductase [Popillia japonica]|uniref:Sulfide:quinone oxidoreductase, mitochondrial n=1 Tax=Popillia japonica TaxID=7064 RepID=A0AAW1KHH9_POPJA
MRYYFVEPPEIGDNWELSSVYPPIINMLDGIVTINNTRVYMEIILRLNCSALNAQHHSKIVIVGGGAGGCSVAAKCVKALGKNSVTIIDPANKHYYQPMFTLAGGGLTKLSQSYKYMSDVLPKSAKWAQDSAAEFDPKNSTVTTTSGDTFKYDVLLIAVGIHLLYEDIPGLVNALDNYSNVGSIYSPKYVEKTYRAIQKFEKGNLIYTYPNSFIKCAGAPLKICFIHEEFLQKCGKRSHANVTYSTTLPVIYSVKVYADALWKVIKSRNINVNIRTSLVEIHPEKNEAIFQNLDKPSQKFTVEYSLLHVVPPTRTPLPLKTNKDLVDDDGFLTVNKFTMQHTRYPNIFGIGDCTNVPTSKTLAAVSQSKVVYNHIRAVLNGKQLCLTYNGYTSCPLVTGIGKCILAEFGYNFRLLETFPIRQDKESYNTTNRCYKNCFTGYVDSGYVYNNLRT